MSPSNRLSFLVVDCSSASAFCATSVSAESVAKAQAGGSGIFGTWKWGCDDPQAFFEGEYAILNLTTAKHRDLFRLD